MPTWPQFFRRVAFTVALAVAAFMTFVWWNTGDEIALGVMGGVWAWAQIIAGFTRWFER